MEGRDGGMGEGGGEGTGGVLDMGSALPLPPRDKLWVRPWQCTQSISETTTSEIMRNVTLSANYK